MLDALLGGDASLQSLKRLIIEKTQGNPFFMEEIVRALVEQGVLVRNGATRLTRPLIEIHVPVSVHGILASRIDALPAAEKNLLQTLAVIGKGFPLSLVRQIIASPDDWLEPMLKSLQAGEFIYEQPALGEAEYTFKHALTQEVAYNSMLMERRRLLHERTGEAIEALFKERIDDHLAELAHHYSRSANTRKAVEYLFRAGSQATARFAYSEAVTRLSSALELLEATTRRRRTSSPGAGSAIRLRPKPCLGKRLGGAGTGARLRQSARIVRATSRPALPSVPFMDNGECDTGSWSCTSARTRRPASGRRRGGERPGDDSGSQLRAWRTLLNSASWSLRLNTWRRRWSFFDLRQPLPAGWSLRE